LKKPLKILDTFAGIGGFSYAAHKLVGGFETTQFVEIDPFCQKVLKKHFPNVPCHDDIKTFTAYPGQYDVITGGFPCQDISVAGRKEGITKQSRSGLFYELIRVIRLVRPKFVVMENVAAILNNGLDIVLGELSEAGYDAEWSIISASSLGAAHRRSRWWCIAYTNSFGCGGGSGKGCSIQGRPFFSGEQTRSKMGSKTERCSSFSADSYNDGLSSTSVNEFNDQTDSNSQKRQNQVSKSSGSSESSNSKTIQSSTEFTNSNNEGLQRKILSKMDSGIWSAKHTRRLDPNWRSYVSKPILPRGSYGLSNRVDRTKALGNSIVPAVAAIPLQRVYDLYYK
jgi:DNA (cytosine-5)-methyltransferase 1